MRRYNSPKKKPIFCKFGYVDYIILASSIAIALGEELSTNDLNILSTFFAVLADELALIGSIENGCSGNSDDETFVPPVPDVAITSRSSASTLSKHYKKSSKVRKCKKKIVRKKIKKK
ncbi:MAG: hypothetical protein ACRC3Y_08300 [Romboutsia sp.]|uniref:hypothetical protein n=1 Tax=Romboutsia sp. TaxID=1965302 RepID=UPI003F2B6ADB